MTAKNPTCFNRGSMSRYNIVSYGSCGDVFLHRTPSEELQCPHCDLIGEPCDFPDLY